MHRVVVTGLGLISPIGASASEFFDALVAPRSGIALIAGEAYSGATPLVAGRIDADTSTRALARLPDQVQQLDRATQFALVAAGDAIADAALDANAESNRDIGVYWGTGLGGATSIESCYRQLYAGDGRVRPTSVVLGMSNAAAAHISIAHQLCGSVVNVSTACSSSATAIGEAYRAIKHGYADCLIAGGSEALLTNGNLRAWAAMQALARPDSADPSRTCKPFSANRSGIVLGEGAASIVLESLDRATARGATVYAELVGYGNAADASHVSKPDFNGQARAMRAALNDANMAPREIGYINAHGTGTAVGDVAETRAIREVFGAAADDIPVSSTKALHGHLIGATGVLELLASILAMARGVVPPTAHLDQSDPACDLDYVPHQARRVELHAAMSNSFGFGGMNSVLVVRRYQQ